MTSDEPLPDRCGAKCRDGGYCTQYPVEGNDRCRMHGGTSPSGREHPNFEHGAYSKHFQSDLTDREQEAHDELVEALDDEEAGMQVIQEAAAEALLKYKRSGDPRFLREARQLLSEFNIIPNADALELSLDAPEAYFESLKKSAGIDE